MTTLEGWTLGLILGIVIGQGIVNIDIARRITRIESALKPDVFGTTPGPKSGKRPTWWRMDQ